MISIIIPYYNNAQQFARTLKSVLAQTLKDFELIIINDASPDWLTALPIIESFKDERIKIISHEENKNGAAARNTGIEASIGDYIAFLDADDEWLPNHLEDSLQFLKTNDYDISYCQSIIKTSGFKDLILPQKGIRLNQTIGNYLFADNGFIPTPSVVYKRQVKTLFNEKLIRHQDYDFLLKAEAAGHKIGMSPHTGVIVHWENNIPTAKGGTWQYSLNWANEYKSLLGAKAYKAFIYKHCINTLLTQKRRAQALQLFITKGVIGSMPLKQWAFFLSNLLFGRIVFSKIKK